MSTTSTTDSVAAISTGPPPPPSRARRTLGSQWFQSVASVVTVLGVWEILARTVFSGSLFVVPTSAVLKALYDWFATGTIWPHLWVSASELLIGFGLAAGVGIAVGVIMGFSKSIYGLANPWVAFLYATPLVAITPFYILIFGVGIASKAALAFTVAVFPVIVNTAAGFRTAEQKYVELARSFGATPAQMIFKVLTPSAVPFILTGLKLAAGRAITGVVVGEFFISRAGVGYLIAQSAQTFRLERMFAGVVMFAFAGLLLFNLFERLERRIAPWRIDAGDQR